MKSLSNITSILFLIFIYGCAQILPLDGGDRDTQAPKLIKSIPENASLNVSVKEFEFMFDEFVQVKDISNQLIITPSTKDLPSVEARGKRIFLKFKNDLEPNTTYRIFFGNSIADMHEGNSLANFEYVFSTGDSINSFKLKGNVINAYNLKPEADITVALYDQEMEDSLVKSSKPKYFSRTNSEGNYNLNYLPNRSFKVFAFGDKNKNLIYDSGEEYLGFLPNKISTSKDTILDIQVFKEELSKIYLKKTLIPYYGMAYLIYNKERFCSCSTRDSAFRKNIFSLNEFNDTCTVYFANRFDTLKLIVQDPKVAKADSVDLIISDRVKFEKQKLEKQIIFDLDIKGMSMNKLAYHENLCLKANLWIDSLSVQTSDFELTLVKDSSITKLPISIKRVVGNEIYFDVKLVPAESYVLRVKESSLQSMTGIKNDSTKFSFITTEPEDYSNLNLKILFPLKENYIVQLLSTDGKIVREKYISMSINSSNEQTLNFKNLIPGVYTAKIIEDKNQNKKWDSGNLIAKRQAERVFLNLSPIKLLANWDSEMEWKVK